MACSSCRVMFAASVSTRLINARYNRHRDLGLARLAELRQA
jgi:hypothetical protein